MTEEAIDDVKQAYALLFKAHGAVASERDALAVRLRELEAALQGCLAMLERADCSTGYCCCGSPIEGHGIEDGHGPVDEGDYHQLNAMDAARAALTTPESKP